MALQAALGTVVDVLGGQATGLATDWQSQAVTGVSTDTRDLQPGDLFVALQGEQFDGHDFAAAALAQGAIAAVVSTPGAEAGPCIQVPDTLVAYQRLGQWWRQQVGAKIVAITGSVGKTTTKELVATVLATQGTVLKTRANYNNEIGVPKTLLELTPEHNFGVIEMGMRGPGEIALLADIAQPDVAVITNVGTAHIGRLGSEQAIAAAKCELLTQLSPQGIAVLNHENARLMATAAGVWSGRQITYGLTGGEVQGTLSADQTAIQVAGMSLPLPLPGRHNALNYLAAIAVMKALALDPRSLAAGITVEMPQGRGRRLQLPGDIVLLDETYNAGVESMQAALQLLAQTPGQRRIAVLGTMKELGAHALDLHQRVGQTVHQCGIDHLLTLADPAEAQALAQGAEPVPTEQFSDHQTLSERLQQMLTQGDRVLFKASRAVALDRVVDALTPGQHLSATRP
jgi:UDP-N-acetylmuramoyl-tripeptide--D-alanyl-D-alanine ligase